MHWDKPEQGTPTSYQVYDGAQRVATVTQRSYTTLSYTSPTMAPSARTATLTNQQLYFELTGLKPASRHVITVKAVDASGESPASNAVVQLTTAAPRVISITDAPFGASTQYSAAQNTPRIQAAIQACLPAVCQLAQGGTAVGTGLNAPADFGPAMASELALWFPQHAQSMDASLALHLRRVGFDPATGVVRVDRFTAVDDFGNVVNPMIVEGQVHGGLAQGIGQALLEHGVYDTETGQLLTGSYMDYAMPRADDLPSFNVETAKGTPCTHNPLGVKGCGEAGAIGSPPAVINAICHALGIKDVPMPATPYTVWKAVQAAR